MERDLDLDWLVGHIPKDVSLQPREDLAERVYQMLMGLIENGSLPYTVGIFGGWGSGKTTFLALLADKLQADPCCKVIYFNSWKYAGFMEIVPSLIYKILLYGVSDSDANREKAAMRVLLSLGKEYSDRFGQWAEKRVGIDVVKLFKDIHQVAGTVAEIDNNVAPEVVKAYYTQVDKAQDVLLEVLGKVTVGEKVKYPVVVLVDELDRCDPDEAFNVIKQMRILFAMRSLPVAFVMCANPEPIGLAIKHRYGLESERGDYESRRILEKFVDAYEDFSETVPLGGLVSNLWENSNMPLPWLIEIDKENNNSSYLSDTVLNANVFDVITTEIPYYANLRVIQKTYNYVLSRKRWNSHLMWTLWHLEILEQLDPAFRDDVAVLASSIQVICQKCHHEIENDIRYRIVGKKLYYEKPEKGKTLFSIFRSYFWEQGRAEIGRLASMDEPEARERVRRLQQLLSDSKKVNFVVSLCLLPFPDLPSHDELLNSSRDGRMPALGQAYDHELAAEFGSTLATY